MARTKKPVSVRIIGKIAFGELNECWNWTGATSGGYPVVWMGWKLDEDGNRIGQNIPCGHRVILELLTGVTIPDDLEVDHTCYNPRCCNPRHLEIVTPEVNRQRAIERRRRLRREKQRADGQLVLMNVTSYQIGENEDDNR